MKKTYFLAVLTALMLSSCGSAAFYSEADEQLYRAIQNGGDVETVRAAVRGGASIDSMKRSHLFGANMVEFAMANGRDDIAVALIEGGADVNYKSSIRGETLLMYSAKSCNYTLCLALIENGAYVSALDRVRDTALEYAFSADDTHTEREVADIVELLLDNGAVITRSTLSAALSGHSGKQTADERYALLRLVVETLRANGESVTLPDALESAVASAGEPADTLPGAAAFSVDRGCCDCCQCGECCGCRG